MASKQIKIIHAGHAESGPLCNKELDHLPTAFDIETVTCRRCWRMILEKTPRAKAVLG